MGRSMTAELSRRTLLRAITATLCFLEHPGFAMRDALHRHLAVLDAPSNLGLKPPSPAKEQGEKNKPAALRTLGIVQLLRADDADALVPTMHLHDLDPDIQ